MSKIYLDEDFLLGHFAVQDESAGLPSILLAPREGELVLDMCAAPGGKAAHIAQLMNNTGGIIAVDKYETKINTLKQNVERLGITNIEFVQDDALGFQSDTINSMKFDKVILDAPCSGLGVLSKKPDIRWKREVEGIINLSKMQRKMLQNAAACVKPGGAIVYSTCTIEPEENADIIKDFLSANPDFIADDAAKYILHRDLVNSEGFIETFPHKHGIDGSFAARLVKKA